MILLNTYMRVARAMEFRLMSVLVLILLQAGILASIVSLVTNFISSFQCIVSDTNFSCIDTKPRAKRAN